MKNKNTHSAVFLFLILVLVCLTPYWHAHAATKKSAPSADSKTVALTFDDGPYGTSTEEVLQILKQNNVHGTFFLIGQNVAKYPQETKQIITDGNSIGNHTYTHTNLSTIGLGQALGDIAKSEQQIASTTGIHTRLFRPPYGVLPDAVRASLVAQGYKIVMWNDDPEDWNNASSTTSQIVTRVWSQRKGKQHLTVIFHDGRDTQIDYPRTNMIQALPVVINDLKAAGYTFVTYGQQ